MALLPIAKIRTDGGTQPRMVMDYDAIEGYMDDMLAGVKFPPVIVFYDGTDYWLADGFHRREAAFGVERKEIEADVRQGTLEDAQWFSFSANRTNGLRRTNEDKQRAVKAALSHPKSSGLSDREIAKHVGVSNHCVGDWRGKLSVSVKSSQIPIERTVSRGASTYQQNTANIGRKPEPKVEHASAPTLPFVPTTAAPPPRAVPAAPMQSPTSEPPRRDLVREATHAVFSSLASAVKLAEAMAEEGDEFAGVQLLESINEFVSAAIEKTKRPTAAR